MRPSSAQSARRKNDDRPSFGVIIICLLAVISSVLMLTRPAKQTTDMEMWLFADAHRRMYDGAIEDWNRDQDPDVSAYLFSNEALRQRMLAAFLSDTPAADVMEVERDFVPQVFTGPIEDVGFVDLTDLLHEEGIYDRINKPSFSPWTSRGRVFGLPHDVHPMVLVYRADIIEAAGIDMTAIATWDDFATAVKPLVKDRNGDGKTDYVISLWATQGFGDHIEALLLQADGPLFDEKGEPAIATEKKARALATMVSWMVGPNRIAVDAPEFDPAANNLRVKGEVLAALMPDWLAGVWKYEMPELSGKLKMMPLPAWEPSGPRTSVWGGTMLGIARTTDDFEGAWRFAKHLYLSKELAKQLYESNGIISPIKDFWDESFYDEPDPYFSNQAPGRLLIELAPQVPLRTSSPFNIAAKDRVANDVIFGVLQYAKKRELYDAVELEAEAMRLLRIAERQVEQQMSRNVFLRNQP